VQYASKTVKAIRQRYSNTETELLAIIWAVTEVFRFYTEFRSSVIYTDHKARIEKSKLNEDSKRIVHLWLKLAKFDATDKHKAKTEMAAADALSRPVACAALRDIHSTEIMKCHVELGHISRKATYEVLKRSMS
jgi:RNase H-like domain found in reverse transcriptase